MGAVLTQTRGEKGKRRDSDKKYKKLKPDSVPSILLYSVLAHLKALEQGKTIVQESVLQHCADLMERLSYEAEEESYKILF